MRRAVEDPQVSKSLRSAFEAIETPEAAARNLEAPDSGSNERSRENSSVATAVSKGPQGVTVDDSTQPQSPDSPISSVESENIRRRKSKNMSKMVSVVSKARQATRVFNPMPQQRIDPSSVWAEVNSMETEISEVWSYVQLRTASYKNERSTICAAQFPETPNRLSAPSKSESSRARRATEIMRKAIAAVNHLRAEINMLEGVSSSEQVQPLKSKNTEHSGESRASIWSAKRLLLPPIAKESTKLFKEDDPDVPAQVIYKN